MCSLYIRVNNDDDDDPKTIFIDACRYNFGSDTPSNPILKFHSLNNSDAINNVDCSHNVTGENDNNWNKIPISLGYFKCARIISECNRYLVKKINKLELNRDNII